MSSTCRRIIVTGIVGGFIGGAVKWAGKRLCPENT